MLSLRVLACIYVTIRCCLLVCWPVYVTIRCCLLECWPVCVTIRCCLLVCWPVCVTIRCCLLVCWPVYVTIRCSPLVCWPVYVTIRCSPLVCWPVCDSSVTTNSVLAICTSTKQSSIYFNDQLLIYTCRASGATYNSGSSQGINPQP